MVNRPEGPTLTKSYRQRKTKEQIETILTIPAVNLGASLSVFTAQNAGAKNFDRCRKGVKGRF